MAISKEEAQKAWDTVCEYLKESGSSNTHTYFTSLYTGNAWEEGHINMHDANERIILISTKKIGYKK